MRIALKNNVAFYDFKSLNFVVPEMAKKMTVFYE